MLGARYKTKKEEDEYALGSQFICQKMLQKLKVYRSSGETEQVNGREIWIFENTETTSGKYCQELKKGEGCERSRWKLVYVGPPYSSWGICLCLSLGFSLTWCVSLLYVLCYPFYCMQKYWNDIDNYLL